MLILKSRWEGGDLLAFGPDSRMLAARFQTGLQIWDDVASGAKARIFRLLSPVASLQFTPDGQSLVFDGLGAGILHLPTGQVRSFPDPELYRYSALSTDGR